MDQVHTVTQHDFEKASRTTVCRSNQVKGKRNVFESVRSIAESAIAKENLTSTSPSAFVRVINRARQRDRYEEPTVLIFKIYEERVADLLNADIKVRGQQCFIFAIPEQLHLLGSAQHFNVDGKFRIARKPFIQLWISPAFIVSGIKYEEVPLLNVLMSNRRKFDYVAILRKTNDLKTGIFPLNFSADFEAAISTVSRVVYPTIRIKVCEFYHCQAIYRQNTVFGSGIRFQTNTGTQVICQKLMSPLFFPVVCGELEFETLYQSFFADLLLSALF